MDDKYLTVTQLNKYIKYKFDTDNNMQTVFLKGEISNFKHHTTGHLYFTLKDENSRILAIMFKTSAAKINFEPQDGSKVLVVGKVSCYEATGAYQIYVNEMLEDGVGNLYIEFEKLKKKLMEKGMFDESHKRKIPKFPKNIGVITAATGAAIRDIITTINRRYPLANVFLFPALVQGENAKDDIVNKIAIANSYDLDVLIIGRGGGSIEDLWAFNEECVANAIYNSDIPVISGVGHEIDFTISDFVADLRAPTPTAAAELAVPSTIELKNNIKQLEIRTSRAIINDIETKKKALLSITDSYILKNPLSIYEVKRQKIDSLLEKTELLINRLITEDKNNCEAIKKRLEVSIKKEFDLKNNKFINLLTKLETLSPISTIKRGYAIVRSGGKVITDIKKLKKDQKIETELVNGKVISIIEKVEV